MVPFHHRLPIRPSLPLTHTGACRQSAPAERHLRQSRFARRTRKARTWLFAQSQRGCRDSVPKRPVSAAQNLPGAHLQLPIESNYTNLNLANNWAAWAGDIGQSAFYQTMTSDSACGPFTQAEAETVIKQLQTEWNDVAIVDTSIADRPGVG